MSGAIKISPSILSADFSKLGDEVVSFEKAGADYILSLKSTNIHLLDEIDSIPILIPDKPDDMNSLFKIIDTCIDKKRTFVADPILEPIHHGFTESIVRYYMLREKYPEIHIMMGTGNITELTHADTTGITMTLMGIISELQINHILTTEVSNHCATVINETDIARRIALSSKIENVTPKHIDNGLLTTHSDKSFIDMLLFVGLGNPSPDNENNRNNIGFKMIDAINQKFSLYKLLSPDAVGIKQTLGLFLLVKEIIYFSISREPKDLPNPPPPIATIFLLCILNK